MRSSCIAKEERRIKPIDCKANPSSVKPRGCEVFRLSSAQIVNCVHRCHSHPPDVF